MFAFVPLAACLMQSLIDVVLVFGVGMDAPSRYSISIARVNSSFLRRSGVRNADANARSTNPPAEFEKPVPTGMRRRSSLVRTDPHRLTVARAGRCHAILIQVMKQMKQMKQVV